MLGNSKSEALRRLKEQRDADYRQPWRPGKGRTDAEILWDYIVELQNELSAARDREYLNSWATNPDRMGGQFSQDEINRARGDTW